MASVHTAALPPPPAPPMGSGHHPHCGPGQGQRPLWGQVKRSLCGCDLDHHPQREVEEEGGNEKEVRRRKRGVKELAYREGEGRRKGERIRGQ